MCLCLYVCVCAIECVCRCVSEFVRVFSIVCVCTFVLARVFCMFICVCECVCMCARLCLRKLNCVSVYVCQPVFEFACALYLACLWVFVLVVLAATELAPTAVADAGSGLSVMQLINTSSEEIEKYGISLQGDLSTEAFRRIKADIDLAAETLTIFVGVRQKMTDIVKKALAEARAAKAVEEARNMQGITEEDGDESVDLEEAS